MGSGEQIDDLIELGTIRLLDWNDAMTDIQLGMRYHTVTTYNPREGIYMVKSLIHLDIYRESDTRTDAYVSDIYSWKTYRRICQSNFYPIGHEDFWRDAPYNLIFYPPNMNNQWGRKQGPRFRGEIDFRNPDSPQDVADVECSDITEIMVITPVQIMYNFFKVL
ncbi:hypothetical protein M9H77_01827 [Catharanthus roseus]|uniref:Uncharacterized protein n=1 Tax=Catharanthus roseus TaxID=4058 RepID=A0ACC0C6M9_CATRO|nr:hypothetical protein M9H77_01827 [Catharanthus roseus]